MQDIDSWLLSDLPDMYLITKGYNNEIKHVVMFNKDTPVKDIIEELIHAHNQYASTVDARLDAEYERGYKRSYDWDEADVRESYYDDGYEDGKAVGKHQGYNLGYTEGYAKGKASVEGKDTLEYEAKS